MRKCLDFWNDYKNVFSTIFFSFFIYFFVFLWLPRKYTAHTHFLTYIIQLTQTQMTRCKIVVSRIWIIYTQVETKKNTYFNETTFSIEQFSWAANSRTWKNQAIILWGPLFSFFLFFFTKKTEYFFYIHIA